MPANRWIVEVDGYGACAVAAIEDGRCILVSQPQSRQACERLMTRLRARDEARTTATRQAAGRRLARSRQVAT